MGQGFTLIYRFKLAGTDQFVLKPRESYGIEAAADQSILCRTYVIRPLAG